VCWEVSERGMGCCLQEMKRKPPPTSTTAGKQTEASSSRGAVCLLLARNSLVRVDFIASKPGLDRSMESGDGGGRRASRNGDDGEHPMHHLLRCFASSGCVWKKGREAERPGPSPSQKPNLIWGCSFLSIRPPAGVCTRHYIGVTRPPPPTFLRLPRDRLIGCWGVCLGGGARDL
jgi:hypothetical protein